MYQPPAPPQAVPHSGRTALIYGILTGLVLGVVESGILVYIARIVYYNHFSAFSLPASILLWIIAFLVAGAIAARRTGKIVTGTLTGLWAGMIGGIITAATSFALLMSSAPYYYFSYTSMYALYLTYLIFLVLFVLGMGTGLGSLGGLIGQSFSGNTLTFSPRYQQREYTQPVQAAPRQYDPPQQEQVIVQYQQISPSQREQPE